MQQTKVPAEVLEKLIQFDSPTVSNVIELFDVRERNDQADGRFGRPQLIGKTFA